MPNSNYAFIDSTNLHIGIKSQEWTLDYTRFRQYLTDKYHVTKAFMFIGYIQTNQHLYKSLQEDGYILIFKPTLKIKGRIKGNTDAELVLQAMIEYPKYDKAVIVSGDGDFCCLVKYLISKDKLLKLVVPDAHSYSSLFRDFNDYIASMNNLKGKLEKKREA